jgi:phenylacetate-coenzyme A ligase PaaK-like adenylate-forming protein
VRRGTGNVSRFQIFLSGHPRLANRLLGFLGPKRVARIGQRIAIRAARRAYASVPFYRALYESHGFTTEQMRHLTVDDFRRLPQMHKNLAENASPADLITNEAQSSRENALVGRSSGTRSKPAYWPVGWNEFLLTNAAFLPWMRYLGTPQGARTAIVIAMSVEGGDASGNIPYRTFFYMKERTGWNMEVIATGEQSEVLHDWLQWLSTSGFTSLMINSFPGTVERFLDYEQSLPADQRVNWGAFTNIFIGLGGQVVDSSLRVRYHNEMHLDPHTIENESILYFSSDTGQITARTTPFTIWLERYIQQHPELEEALGLTTDTRDKPLMELMPPMAMHYEIDAQSGLLLTLWKIRPLIRYAIGDRLWLPKSPNILSILNRTTPQWRRNFAQAGGHRGDVTRATRLTVVLGRADAVVIVNGANISSDITGQAIALAGLTDTIHHFKHANNPKHPNVYHVFLELNQSADAETCQQFERDWQPRLLAALLQVPAAIDLVAAHRTNPIDLRVYVRSRGEDEFNDDQSRKRTYTLTAEQINQLTD